MQKKDVIATILGTQLHQPAAVDSAEAFAPSNIALCKYWGKRDQELNLPLTSSLSISLRDKGTQTKLSIIDSDTDSIVLNNQIIDMNSTFATRLVHYLDLFRPDIKTKNRWHLAVNTTNNIPSAAGLASSASGFAALVRALNQLFAWQLSPQHLSILARLGSGSACRSLSDGFVEWLAGEREDGMDSNVSPIATSWPELCIGLLIVSDKTKPLSSREAMARTVTTSPFMSLWPAKVENDLSKIKDSILRHDFSQLGQHAESNANAMHALMLSAWPPISYTLPETIAHMQRIWWLRSQGLLIYYTQDAGPNLKLLFLAKDIPVLKSHFDNLDVILPFAL